MCRACVIESTAQRRTQDGVLREDPAGFEGAMAGVAGLADVKVGPSFLQSIM